MARVGGSISPRGTVRPRGVDVALTAGIVIGSRVPASASQPRHSVGARARRHVCEGQYWYRIVYRRASPDETVGERFQQRGVTRDATQEGAEVRSVAHSAIEQ